MRYLSGNDIFLTLMFQLNALVLTANIDHISLKPHSSIVYFGFPNFVTLLANPTLLNSV